MSFSSVSSTLPSRLPAEILGAFARSTRSDGRASCSHERLQHLYLVLVRAEVRGLV